MVDGRHGTTWICLTISEFKRSNDVTWLKVMYAKIIILIKKKKKRETIRIVHEEKKL